MIECAKLGGPAIFVVGTRAQLIKVAPVIVACEALGHPVSLLLTGQHKETMQDLIQEFGICTVPSEIMEVSERSTVFSLLRWIPACYVALSTVLRSARKTDARACVVVHGDTMSTVLGAVAAKRRGVAVVHLESGLTSGKLFNPFPEELSRRIVFRLADVAMCPGRIPADHMRAHYRCTVVDTTENTIVDSVRIAAGAFPSGEIDSGKPYFVASIHRFQNIFDSRRIHALAELLISLSSHFPIHFVLHPATRKRLVAEKLLDRMAATKGLELRPRLGYSAFLKLASGAACVLTDGGSNQEELAVLGVPTLIMREFTERGDGLGENAMLEGDVQGSMLDYCLNGRFNSLRRPSRIGNDSGPSRQIAEFLAGPTSSAS